MKLSISEELEEVDFTPLKSVVDAYINKFGSEERAMHALEFRIQQVLRFSTNHKKNYKPRVKITLSIDKNLKMRLNSHCAERSYTYNHFLEKVMKCTRKP